MHYALLGSVLAPDCLESENALALEELEVVGVVEVGREKICICMYLGLGLRVGIELD